MLFTQGEIQSPAGGYYAKIKYLRIVETLTVDNFGNITIVVHKLNGSFVSQNTIPPKIPNTLPFEGISDDDLKLR